MPLVRGLDGSNFADVHAVGPMLQPRLGKGAHAFDTVRTVDGDGVRQVGHQLAEALLVGSRVRRCRPVVGGRAERCGHLVDVLGHDRPAARDLVVGAGLARLTSDLHRGERRRRLPVRQQPREADV